MKGILVFILLAILALAAGCNGSTRGQPDAAGREPGGPVRLEKKDDGKQVELEQGQDLIVVLEGNPSTGYGWEVAEIDEQVLQAGSAEFQPRSDLEGAPGAFALPFQAVGKGQTTLRLNYRRSWEKDVQPVETFAVQVVVH
jgi:inhibitor of cysteine peptidase